MDKITKEQGIIITGFTGIVCCKFSDFHEDIERRLKRSIWTHQFADESLWKEIKEVYRKDFMELQPDE